MQSKFAALCLIFGAGLSGCAIGPGVKPDLPNALTAQIQNDATGMMTMRGAIMYTYADERCEGAVRVASKLSMSSQEMLATMPLASAKPLTFSLSTTNANGLKGNWGCSVTSTFTPVQGARYQATLQTEGDNATCKVTIRDQDNREMTARSPEYSCERTIGGTARNGRRWSGS